MTKQEKSMSAMNNFELEHVIRTNKARLIFLQASFQEQSTHATTYAAMGHVDAARSYLSSLPGYLADIEKACQAIEAASDQLTHNLTVEHNSKHI